MHGICILPILLMPGIKWDSTCTSVGHVTGITPPVRLAIWISLITAYRDIFGHRSFEPLSPYLACIKDIKYCRSTVYTVTIRPNDPSIAPSMYRNPPCQTGVLRENSRFGYIVLIELIWSYIPLTHSTNYIQQLLEEFEPYDMKNYIDYI
jgi:hypothetical protein